MGATVAEAVGDTVGIEPDPARRGVRKIHSKRATYEKRRPSVDFVSPPAPKRELETWSPLNMPEP